MANLDIHMYWKGKKRDLNLVIFLSMCFLVAYWFHDDIGMTMIFFFLILAYPILAKIDRDRENHGGENIPTLKKWFSKFKK